MAAENNAGIAISTKPATAAREFVRRYTNLLCELRLQTGIRQRIETMLNEFAEVHPNLRASYISRDVDESYFNDGSCGWEAAARPKLQGLAIEGENLFEFLSFTNGLRTHTTPLNSIVNVEELWLETAQDQPFVLRISLYHSFPATTLLYAPNGETQEGARAFLQRLKYLRGF
jgi:hypothetical protein